MYSTKEFKEYFQWSEDIYPSISHSWFDIKSDKGKREREKASKLYRAGLTHIQQFISEEKNNNFHFLYAVSI